MTDWSKPTNVDALTATFGVGIEHTLMPPMAEIPEEFKSLNRRSKWLDFQSDWFFYGLKDVAWTPKAGVDVQVARRHLAAIQGSFEPKHEHKAAAVAYLTSLWFDDVTYKRAKEYV